jgi:hypothetical protein
VPTFRPAFEGQIPSLGGLVKDWIQDHCVHGRGDVQGMRAVVDPEMAKYLEECYRIHPESGRRVYDESMLSRPKGRAKTEMAGWIGLAEAFSDAVRFADWDEDGQPIGQRVHSPLLKCLATEEEQATASFSVIAYNVEVGLRRGDTTFEGVTGSRVHQSAKNLYIAGGGEIRACSSGAASKDGGLETWVVADETHLYVLPALKEMYRVVQRNLGKRAGATPWLMQTTTQFRVGEQSVAEQTLDAWRKGVLGGEVHVDHREAKGPIRIRDKAHTLKQLRHVYGAAADRMDMEGVYRKMTDPRICADDATAARYYLNRPMANTDAWIAKDVYERQQRVGDGYAIAPDEPIAIGFDGSLNDDSTVLRGCRMSDGFLFRIGVWERPEGAAAIGWEVPRLDVLATFREAFSRYRVVRAYCDPHEWRSDIDTLAEEFREVDRKGRATERVFSWETRRDTAMGHALDRLHADLVNGTAVHDDDPVAAKHYGNAYVAHRHGQRLVRKEYPNSPRKIDSVAGDALAYEARADAIADGWDIPKGGLSRVKGTVRSY